MATTIAAKGDILAGTANDAYSALTVGANGTVLTAASGEATGLQWATVAAGSNWSLLNSGGTALTGAATITVSGISGKDKIAIIVDGGSSASTSSIISLRLNTDTGNNYYSFGNRYTTISSYVSDNFRAWEKGSEQDRFRIGQMSGTANSTVFGFCLLNGCNASGVKIVQVTGGGLPEGDNGQGQYNYGGYYNSASTISSVSVVSSTGNFDAGTVYVYTSA